MSHSTPAIPIGAHPDPIVAYTIADDTAVVTAVNDAFEATFDGFAPETVSDVLDRFLVESRRDVRDSVLDGEPIEWSLEGDAAYVARNVPGDDECGFLVLSPIESTPATEAIELDHVASVVSHDLRNPLDVAKAHLRAAAETGDEQHFEAVAAAHDRMEHIVRDVLTLASGEDAIDTSNGVSVDDLVGDAWQSVETDRATLHVEEPLPVTRADPDRVRRLFENLFRNSVEHGSTDALSNGQANGVAHDSTSGQAGADDGVEIRVGPLSDGFYVSDDGPGIPESERDAALEAGYTTDERGTGLGLAIVERIVEAHGWELSLTDAESGGVRFEVRFDRQTEA
ncbi:sensor histidine kinase [Halapricum desulfuricans]|uniref:histidine kinase n=1 Tax=Halapricum desulfuricans TaxID=2841257 RepID=A0A897N2P6_9EURY|nr:HAMP domain-containing sensor histidine kinase [Halapricum desulfuricans]QSG04995.1 Signal transduction histidine kinase [Halapricum desulfuricans]